MSFKLSKEDVDVLLKSEVYRELEGAAIKKQAQATLADKIVNSPSAQVAISEGIRKALENKDDDGECGELKEMLKALPDHELYEVAEMFQEEVKSRGLDTEEQEEKFEKEEAEEHEEDEGEEDKEAEVVDYVMASLTRLAHNAADGGNMEAAYLLERVISTLNKE